MATSIAVANIVMPSTRQTNATADIPGSMPSSGLITGSNITSDNAPTSFHAAK